jgi:hypothetical protein
MISNLKNILQRILTNFFKKCIQNKNIFYFTILKYFEYIINSFLFFKIAKIVTPYQYGDASSSFLLITYSSFAVLGINQVIVKWSSKSKSINFKRFLINYSLIYNIVFSVIVFLLIFNISKSNYRISLSIICSLRLIIESIITIFRISNKPLYINYVYISISSIFLMLFLIIVNNMTTFFIAWSISIVLGLIISVVLFSFFNETKAKISLKTTYKYFKIYNIKFLIDGFNLSMITIISTLFVTADKFFYINIFKFPNLLLGNIQLSDNISSVLSLGLGSVLFIITPQVLNLIHESKIDLNYFINISYKITGCIIVLILVLFFPIISLLNYFFENYKNLSYPFFTFLIIKTLNLALFVPSIISMVKSKEILYVKTSFIWVVLMLLSILSLKYFNNINLALYITPIIVIVNLIFLHLNLIILLRKSSI